MQDRAGHSNGFDEFLVDPAAFSEDPLQEFANGAEFISGAFGGPVLLSGKPFSFEELLNEWVRFLKPGRFRIALLSRRAAQVADPTRSEYYSRTHPSGKAVVLVSNILTLNIVPAPAVWVKGQIAGAVRVLDAPVDFSEDTHQRRLRAGRTLRFLNSPEAAVELVRHLGSGEDSDSFALHMGVLGSPYRKRLLPLMEARLIAPDQPVSNRFLDTLCRLSVLVAREGSMDIARKKYHERLIASLADKEPEPRAISIIALLDSGFGSGGRALSASLIADFRVLSVRTQTNLLESHWSVIRSPAMLPALREIYAHPPEPRLDPSLRDLAVRRIYDLAPEEGRRIIVSEIARPDTSLSSKTLEILPDDRLPELNGVLAKDLEANQYPDALIVRYATGDIVRRVEAAYRKRNEQLDQQKLPHCGGPLVYYFLRYDPAFGERNCGLRWISPRHIQRATTSGFNFCRWGGTLTARRSSGWRSNFWRARRFR